MICCALGSLIFLLAFSSCVRVPRCRRHPHSFWQPVSPRPSSDPRVCAGLSDELAREAVENGANARARLLGPQGDPLSILAFELVSNAMCPAPRRLTVILDALNDAFPRLQRVGVYANARDILSKTDRELAELRRRGLKIVYLGLESGDDATLEAVHKGATAAEIVRAGQRARAAGLNASVMVLVGLAGADRSLVARAAVDDSRRCDGVELHSPAHLHAGRRLTAPRRGLGRHVRRPVTTTVARRDPRVRRCRYVRHLPHVQPRQQLPAARRPPASRDLDAALRGSIALKPELLRGLWASNDYLVADGSATPKHLAPRRCQRAAASFLSNEATAVE
jgi:hypothetical protein